VPVTSPATNLSLESTFLMPLVVLQKAIETYIHNRPELYRGSEQQALHASVIEELKRLQVRIDQLEGVEASNEALQYELEEMRRTLRDRGGCQGGPASANNVAQASGDSTIGACGAASTAQPAPGRSLDQAACGRYMVCFVPTGEPLSPGVGEDQRFAATAAAGPPLSRHAELPGRCLSPGRAEYEPDPFGFSSPTPLPHSPAPPPPPPTECPVPAETAARVREVDETAPSLHGAGRRAVTPARSGARPRNRRILPSGAPASRARA
jgi:hypothetical protein